VSGKRPTNLSENQDSRRDPLSFSGRVSEVEQQKERGVEDVGFGADDECERFVLGVGVCT
jgi:hypothetical protein